ncbi:phage terminase large subunit, partial [Clostridioides difficile]
DVLYTKESMETTEYKTAKMFYENEVNKADIESNNGGRAFARSVQRLLKEKFNSNKTTIKWFHQSKNKNARILSNSSWVMEHIYFPPNWRDKWTEFYKAMTSYQREGKNKHDDAPDALTGVAEKALKGQGLSVFK